MTEWNIYAIKNTLGTCMHTYIFINMIEITKCVYLGILFSSLKEDVLKNMFNKIWD